MTHRLTHAARRAGLAPLALFALALLALPPRAASHELPSERAMILQLRADRVEVMLIHDEPPGERVDLLLARYDFDRDGELSPSEGQLAGAAWLGYAIDGVTLEVVGEAPASHPPQIKFKRTEDGGLAMAALLRFDVPPLAAGAARTLRVRLAKQAGTLETQASIQCLGGPRLVSIAGKPITGEQTPPFTLYPGANLAITFAMPEGDTQKSE